MRAGMRSSATSIFGPKLLVLVLGPLRMRLMREEAARVRANRMRSLTKTLCCRMLPYVEVCCRMLPYADVCCRMRVQANRTLSHPERLRILREKYDAITRPARVALEPLRRLFQSLSHVTETGEEEGEASPHDKTFVKRFGAAFAEALEACLNPRDVYQVLVYAALSY